MKYSIVFVLSCFYAKLGRKIKYDFIFMWMYSCGWNCFGKEII